MTLRQFTIDDAPIILSWIKDRTAFRKWSADRYPVFPPKPEEMVAQYGACYEFAWKNAPEGVSPWLLTIPIFVGAAIGGLVGYHYHRKAVNAAQDILDEINN